MFTHSVKSTDGKCRDRFKTPSNLKKQLFAKIFNEINPVNTFPKFSA